MQRFLKCYAEGSPGDWEAICVDLDIVVQGDSLDAVMTALQDSIELYFETISELPAEDRERLLSRRSPLWLSAKLYFKFGYAKLLDRLRNNGDGDRPSHEGWTVSCPA